MPTKNLDQRDNIQAIARKLFATKGYEATTTRKINTLAKTSDGLLYYYFPGGKKALLDSILLEARDRRTKTLASFTFESVADREAVAHETLRFFKFIWRTLIDEENYQVFQITVREKHLLTDQQIAWIQRLNQSILDDLTAFLANHADLLTVDTDAIPVLSQSLIATFQAMIFTQLVMTDQRQLTPQSAAALSQRVHLILAVD